MGRNKIKFKKNIFNSKFSRSNFILYMFIIILFYPKIIKAKRD